MAVVGDTLVSVNGVAVHRAAEAERAIAAAEGTVAFVLRRPALEDAFETVARVARGSKAARFGIEFTRGRPSAPVMVAKLENGLLCAQTGAVQSGDYLIAVNGVPVTSVAAAVDALGATEEGVAELKLARVRCPLSLPQRLPK